MQAQNYSYERSPQPVSQLNPKSELCQCRRPSGKQGNRDLRWRHNDVSYEPYLWVQRQNLKSAWHQAALGQGRRERVQGPAKNFFCLLPPPSKEEAATNLYTKLERLSVSCRVTWAWSERVNLYSRQTVITRETTKHMQHSGAPGTGNLYRFLPRRHCAREESGLISAPPPPWGSLFCDCQQFSTCSTHGGWLTAWCIA